MYGMHDMAAAIEAREKLVLCLVALIVIMKFGAMAASSLRRRLCRRQHHRQHRRRNRRQPTADSIADGMPATPPNMLGGHGQLPPSPTALIGFAQSPACFGVQDEQTGSSTLCCRMRGIVRPSVELDGWQRVEVKNEAYDAAVAGEIGYLWVAGNADGLYLEDEVWSSERCAVAAPAPPLEEVAPQSAAPAPPLLEEVASQSSAPAPPLDESQFWEF